MIPETPLSRDLQDLMDAHELAMTVLGYIRPTENQYEFVVRVLAISGLEETSDDLAAADELQATVQKAMNRYAQRLDDAANKQKKRFENLN